MLGMPHKLWLVLHTQISTNRRETAYICVALMKLVSCWRLQHSPSCMSKQHLPQTPAKKHRHAAGRTTRTLPAAVCAACSFCWALSGILRFSVFVRSVSSQFPLLLTVTVWPMPVATQSCHLTTACSVDTAWC